MTKDEIKKGLECCCCNSDFKNACRNCSYLTCPGCNDTLCKDALTLITEQENEIERLRTTLRQCNTELNNALESLKSQCREIGELKAENARLTEKLKQVLLAVDTVKEITAMCNIDKQNAEIERLKDDYAKLQELFAQYQMASDKEIRAQIKQAKIDVLNELKAKSYVNDYCREVVEVEKIDDLLKENEQWRR